jgi:hypothetical protein
VVIGRYRTHESCRGPLGTFEWMNGPANGRVDEATTLAELFERYESLPSRDEVEAKRALVDRMLAAMAPRLASDEESARYRPIRDAGARVRLLTPGADDFDAAVLTLIDAAREAFGEDGLAEVAPAAAPERGEHPRPDVDGVTEASEESFPASDPPGYVAGADGSR